MTHSRNRVNQSFLSIKDRFQVGIQRTLTVVFDRARSKARRTAVVDLSENIEFGLRDLGDLIVEVPPLVAAGIVLDQSGEPVIGATVRVQRWAPDVAQQIDGWSSRDFEDWHEINGLSARTGADGNFSLSFNLEDGRYRLSASHQDFLTTPREFSLYQTNLEVRMAKQVSAIGRVLLDPHIDQSKIKVVIYCLDDSKESGYSTHEASFTSFLPMQSGQRFTVDKLVVGSARLKVQSRSLNEDLFVLDSLVLQAERRQMRVPDIDLRGRLKSISVSLVDEQHRPIRGGWIQLAGTSNRLWTFAEPLELLTLYSGLNLEAGGYGWRTVTLDGIRENVEVVLQR